MTAPPADGRLGAGEAGKWLLAAALLALLSAAALWADLPTARWVKRATDGHRLPGDLTRIVTLSETFGYGGTVAVIILAAVLLDPRGRRVAPRLLLCAFGAGLLADVGKLLIARQRPAHADLDGNAIGTFITWLPAWRLGVLKELGVKYGHAIQSYPSGHAATAFGLAIGLSLLYPRGKWLFLTIAVLSSFQRLVSHAHYLSDVLLGAALACVVTALLKARSPLGRWLDRLEDRRAV